jgi:hypothetical protein
VEGIGRGFLAVCLFKDEREEAAREREDEGCARGGSVGLLCCNGWTRASIVASVEVNGCQPDCEPDNVVQRGQVGRL